MAGMIELVDSVVTRLEVESGLSPRVLAARGTAWRLMATARPRVQRMTPWTAGEEAFVRKQLGKMTDAQIGEALGRSEVAIKIRRQRRGLGAHSKRPGWITANKAAKWMGLDGHAVMHLFRSGMIPGEVYPGKRGIVLIRITTLVRWAVNPLNWIYFRQDKVRNEHLRRLLEIRRLQWHDRWMTSGEVAQMHGVSDANVNKFILTGRLPAVKWGNWWILRSEAVRMRFTLGKGSSERMRWSVGGDGFLVLGRAIGLSTSALDRMSKAPTKRAAYRLHRLAESGEMARIAGQLGIGCSIDKGGYMLYADWRTWAWRFPRVGRAMERFEKVVLLHEEEMLSKDEIQTVRGVLEARLRWFGDNHPTMVLAAYRYEAAMRRLIEAYREILRSISYKLFEIASRE